MMVGLAMATMVESTMIMKKPIIIAQSACQGFSVRDTIAEFQRFAKSAPLGPARRVLPGDRGVAVVISPPRFSSRRWCPAQPGPSALSGRPVYPLARTA